MREIFKGFLVLGLFALILLLIVIVVLLGVSALSQGSGVRGIAILAAVPAAVVAVLGWLVARRAGERRRYASAVPAALLSPAPQLMSAVEVADILQRLPWRDEKASRPTSPLTKAAGAGCALRRKGS